MKIIRLSLKGKDHVVPERSSHTLCGKRIYPMLSWNMHSKKVNCQTCINVLDDLKKVVV